MRYQQVRWQHDFPDEPVELFSEIGPDDWEVRRVDRYRDGRLLWSDDTGAGPGDGVGQAAFDPIDVINADPEFVATEITAQQFDRVWTAARRPA